MTARVLLALDTPTAVMAYIVAPTLTAMGGISVAIVQIRRARTENRSDHDRNLDAIRAIATSVEAVHGEVKAVGDRLSDHIDDHQNRGPRVA